MQSKKLAKIAENMVKLAKIYILKERRPENLKPRVKFYIRCKNVAVSADVHWQ